VTDATEAEIRRRVDAELAARDAADRKFTPFPAPVHPNDTPLVQHAGIDYRCTGCGAVVPDGVWIYETVKDGMVVGLRMEGGSSGQFTHRCGEVER
jgi:hypothetical protein